MEFKPGIVVAGLGEEEQQRGSRDRSFRSFLLGEQQQQHLGLEVSSSASVCRGRRRRITGEGEEQRRTFLQNEKNNL